MPQRSEAAKKNKKFGVRWHGHLAREAYRRNPTPGEMPVLRGTHFLGLEAKPALVPKEAGSSKKQASKKFSGVYT